MEQIKNWLIERQTDIKDWLKERQTNIKNSVNRWTIAYFLLGMVWAWGLTAMFVVVMQINYGFDTQRQFTVGHLESGIPNAINTVQTIPVEVYKLEREE